MTIARLMSPVLRPLFALSFLVSIFACSKAGDANAGAKAAPSDSAAPSAQPAAHAYDDSDCNFETELQPGIPGSPGNLIVSTRNPNGDSELAVLMRRFVDDLRDVRTLLEAGEPVPKLWPVHRKMRCAWFTKPDERTEEFDRRAQGYLLAVRTFDEAPGKATYNGIIAGCISCHAVSCGGPLDFIGSMAWQ